MAIYDKALITLEYNKIINMLADCAATEGAKELAYRLQPFCDKDKIEKLLEQTNDAKYLVSIKGQPTFGAVKNVNISLDRALKSAVLTTRELLDIANLLRVVRRLIDYINSDKKFEVLLNEYFDRLTGNRMLEEKINRAIVAEDMIADEASIDLAEIRRKIRFENNRIKDNLQKFISNGTYSKYLQENIVTMRNGRYVIPVKIEYKNEIKGLIHDTSASGATVFIEPLTVLESNNALRELQSAEEHEIEKILAELSALCADDADNISLDYYNVTELAFIFAKADLSIKMNAACPKINDKQIIELYKARHPLLDYKTVVPVNIMLGGRFDTLVITGPNTGGKTVSLKTIGLFALMTQAGLHIPADDTSTMCIFDEILADIGDEQSIEQSLSTFSAHMVNIVYIIENAGDKSLVLFDELGAGTDPVEGAALAIAILENVRFKRSLCAATTHYAELKAFALDTDGVSNASCEFNIETLKPTYRLIIGTPGKSNAFAISKKLGLSDGIIARAGEYVSKDSKRFEYVVEKLEQSRIEMEEQRDAAIKLRREYEEFKSTSERNLREKIEETTKELEKSRAQAVRIVEGAKATSDYVLKQLEELKKHRESERLSDELEEARRNIRQQLKQTDTGVDFVTETNIKDYELPRPLVKGDEVIISNINKKGVLTADPDKDGNVVVQAGIINTKTNIKNLILVEDDKVTFTDKTEKKISPTEFKTSVTRNFTPEIDVRGMNGEDAWFSIDKYLDNAKVANVLNVSIIHGKGTGALKNAVWKNLKNDYRVKSYRLGQYGEGDLGVTIIDIK
ncbi:MAG: endonuclease MutS2 [Oscillospiraceae bacterium]|nr:endonuclease MutS2 [Oscillospiraceae bacterium]